MARTFYITKKTAWNDYWSLPEYSRDYITLHKVPIGTLHGNEFLFANIFRDWVALTTAYNMPEFFDPHEFHVDFHHVIDELDMYDSTSTVDIWSYIIGNTDYIIVDDRDTVVYREEMLTLWDSTRQDITNETYSRSAEHCDSFSELTHIDDGHTFTAMKR